MVLKKESDIGVPPEEPKQFTLDQAKGDFLGSQQWEALTEVKAHLVAKDRPRARSRPVRFLVAIFQNVAGQVEVLLFINVFCHLVVALLIVVGNNITQIDQ